MPLKHLNPEGAPPPASRYSQAVEVADAKRWLHVSGQVGVTPDGKTADGAEAQHEQVWRNILAILEGAGMDAGNLVKVTGYVTTADQVPLFRQVRDRMLGGARPASTLPASTLPASTLIVVAALASPDWLVEIEAVAAA